MIPNIALVSGASGFIGTRLVAHLRAKGVPLVRALDTAPPRQRLAGVEYLTADVRQPIDAAVGEGVDLIYNLAATHRTPGHPAHEYYDTNVLGAANICALAEAAAVRTIVFTSSISVYGPSEEIIDEHAPLNPVSHYGRSKRMAEILHEQWAGRDAARRLIVIRPGVVFGPGEGGNFTTLANALRRGRFAYPGRKDAIKGGGYVGELMGVIDFTLAQDDHFILSNFAYPEQSTSEDIVKAFGKVAGFKSEYPVVPITPLLAVAMLFEIANAAGLKTPIHRERVLKLVQSTRVTPGWLRSRGYPFATCLETALEHWRDETSGAFR